MEKSQLFEKLENSPYFPRIPVELSDIISMLQDPKKVDIDELVEKIEAVTDLEAIIIAYINSDYFKVKKVISSLREAIIYLGMHTMQVIIISSIFRYLFPEGSGKSSVYKKNSYLKHSIGTAVASCALSEATGLGDKYELFAYGLVHDIGISVLDACYPESIEKCFEIERRGINQIIAERIVLGGIAHPDVGAWLSEKWNFPLNITEVIKRHHWPVLEKDFGKAIQLIYMGDVISTNYFESLLLVGEKVDFNMKIQKAFDISDELIQEISAELPEEVERVMVLFKI